MEIDRNGLEVLEPAECLRLLAGASLGRIAITSGALPVVLPINYRLIGDVIAFRTGLGSKLDAATRNNVVAFEVDDMDPLWHTGWSVMVTGIARIVSDPAEEEALTSVGVPKWAPTVQDRLVVVSTDVISGRRMGPAPAPALA